MNWFAMSQGREVFALPGKVDSSTSFGTNSLIKQGAKLVSCVDDILEEFSFSKTQSQKEKEADKSILFDFNNAEETTVYNLISEQPIQLDELLEKTNLYISKASDILLKL